MTGETPDAQPRGAASIVSSQVETDIIRENGNRASTNDAARGPYAFGGRIGKGALGLNLRRSEAGNQGG